MTPQVQAWINGHIDRLDRGTNRTKVFSRAALLRGLSVAWAEPHRLDDRLADLAHAEPDSYRTASMARVVGVLDDLQDERGLFAAACLNSVGLWGTMLDRARPAADLVSFGDTALAPMLAGVVLTATQGDTAKGRPPAGVLEELRDLGLTAMLPEFRDAKMLALFLGWSDDHGDRQVYRAVANWR